MKKLISTIILAGTILVSGTNAQAAAKPNKSYKDDLIIINKTYNKLAYYQDRKFVGMYSVATGRKDSYTPEGTFKIAQKIVNRPYYAGRIPGGDPRNPLGNRWLGIAVPKKGKPASWGGVYGIHGNNNPKSIGKYVSGGCIRMYDADIEKELYPKVLMNTPVKILKSYKSFKNIAKDMKYIK